MWALERKLTHQWIKLRYIALRLDHGHRGTDTLELPSRCRATHSKLQKLKQIVRQGHASTTRAVGAVRTRLCMAQVV